MGLCSAQEPFVQGTFSLHKLKAFGTRARQFCPSYKKNGLHTSILYITLYIIVFIFVQVACRKSTPISSMYQTPTSIMNMSNSHAFIHLQTVTQLETLPFWTWRGIIRKANSTKARQKELGCDEKIGLNQENFESLVVSGRSHAGTCGTFTIVMNVRLRVEDAPAQAKS